MGQNSCKRNVSMWISTERGCSWEFSLIYVCCVLVLPSPLKASVRSSLSWNNSCEIFLHSLPFCPQLSLLVVVSWTFLSILRTACNNGFCLTRKTRANNKLSVSQDTRRLSASLLPKSVVKDFQKQPSNGVKLPMISANGILYIVKMIFLLLLFRLFNDDGGVLKKKILIILII